MLKTLILFAIIAAGSLVNSAVAQQEYFVQVNRTTGAYYIIDSIPPVHYIADGPGDGTTLDKEGNRFFFIGLDRAGVLRLYTLNATNGHVIDSPALAQLTGADDFIGQLQYDDSAKTLYGIYRQGQGHFSFMRVNEVTGVFTVINPLPTVAYVANGVDAYSQKDHAYYFVAGNDADRLYKINAADGAILLSPTTNRVLTGLEYDNVAGKMYAQSRRTILQIDPATAAATPVATNIDDLLYEYDFPNYTTFDERRHIYITAGNNASGIPMLLNIDVTTGNVISSVPFWVGSTSTANLVEFVFDNKNDTLYGLHWGYLPVKANGHSTPPVCYNDCNGKASVTAYSGTTPYSYRWSQYGITDTGITNLCAGTYYVTVTDQQGYSITDTIIVQQPIKDILAATTAAPIFYLGDSVEVCATGGFTAYSWNNGYSTGCAYAANTGTYTVTATSAKGCIVEDSVTVNSVPQGGLFLPNAFTPNNDGVNDVLELYGNKASLGSFSLSVFDRLGELVFQTTNSDFRWDGTYKGKILPMQVLVYNMRFSLIVEGIDESRKGSITLLK